MSQAKRARPLPDAGSKLLTRFPADVRALMLQLRGRILEVMPRAHEVVVDVGYTVTLRYGPDDKMKSAFLYITGFAAHANLGFLQGAAMDDPDHALEGSGTAMRHVKFRSAEELAAAKWLDRYVRAALSHAGLSPHLGDAQTEIRPRNGESRATNRGRGARPRDSTRTKRL